ncbi:uncharacterized protein LOC120013240 isoform X2 [Tripterygium wilfordii]|nr:uncharacterized protein LOC120013240 isoform X2 [Tripterygium wilfordii]
MTHLNDELSIGTLPICNKLTALVMVFDMSDLSTLVALQEWVSVTDIQKFEILLCIGNKVDRIPGHPVHSEYRRHLQKPNESPEEFTEYGISETEGSSLLDHEEPSSKIRKSCVEWCCEHNIEFIESCALDAAFDKCLSIDGDSQGVERLFGALSAHMWPGMVLKSGDKITEPSLPEKEELSEEESDYELDYERLSVGSAEPWDDTDVAWVSANDPNPVARNDDFLEGDPESGRRNDKEELEASTSKAALQNGSDNRVLSDAEEPDKDPETDEGTPFDFEELERLMSEIGNMRGTLRLMPDFQRREMAAKLAMKMASMFGGGSDGEEELD